MKNQALDELIERLTHEAAQIDQAVKMHTRERDKQQDLLDEADGRLLSKQELIAFLRASAEEMAEPKWKKGDRFRWRGYSRDEAEITGIDASRVYTRSDSGAVITMDRSEFQRLVERA